MSAERSCMTESVLAAFAEGALDQPTAWKVAAHVAECSECAELVQGVLRFAAEQQREQPKRSPRVTWWFAAACVASACIIGLIWRFATRDPLTALRQAVNKAEWRPVEGWLAGFDHAPFRLHRSGTLQQNDLEIRAAASEVERLPSSDWHMIHARGIAALVTGNPAHATQILEEAARAAAKDPTYWSDLAAARIALGTSTQDTAHFRSAIAAADRALALDPRSGPALYNRAVALEHLGDRPAAVRAYRSALTTKLPDPWRREVVSKIE